MYYTNVSKFSKIVLPWGKFEYQKLSMGLCNSPDIFQEKMNELFSDLEHPTLMTFYLSLVIATLKTI